MFKAIRNPDFDHRLPGDAEAFGLSVKRLDHPNGKVDIDSLLFPTGACSLGEVEVFGHVFAIIKLLVKLFSLHTALPPLSENAGSK